MTEQTQTTAERIRNLIFDAIQDSPYGDESIVAAPLGVTIAAEIDALKAEVERLTPYAAVGFALFDPDARAPGWEGYHKAYFAAENAYKAAARARAAKGEK